MSAILLPDGLLLHYEVMGRGRPPVLFLHSWIGSWRYWLLSMEEAALHRRAYAVDLPGYGGSVGLDPSQQDFRVDTALESILYFLNTLGVDKVVLVGHGLGSLLALEMALRHPGRVDRLMTVALPWNGVLLSRWQRRSPRQLVSRLFVQSQGGEELHVAKEEIQRTSERVFHQSLEWAEEYWATFEGGRLEQPWLLLYGEKDPLVPPIPEEKQDMLPRAYQRHVLVVPQTGHFPMLEHPRPFHRVLRAFLEMTPDQELGQLHLREEWQRRVR